MKTAFLNRISTLALWLCMIVTGVVFSGFYYIYSQQEMVQPGIILWWAYIIFAASTLLVFLFSLIRSISSWKENPKTILYSAGWLLALAAILTAGYILGDGTPLPMPGYEGGENTSFWLIMSDMWIYSLYILLALNVVALLGGILWSYIKKTR